ncbi:MAG: NAD(P)H-hydrate dehydratase [Acidobacteriales bacterium]|nr:NAD(P)H-hydrate dehydratase [Terriglobales bacterium]
MKKIITAAEMRAIDRASVEQCGVPSLTLMENAGSAVAEVCLDRFGDAERVTVVCGRGNNGGDGFVVARKLSEAGKDVTVLLLARPEDVRGDAAEMLLRMKQKPIVATRLDELPRPALLDSDLIVDAILGTGFRPPVEGIYAEAIHAINASGAPVVAVDIPSGAETDTFTPADIGDDIVPADVIVTFTAYKPAHIFRFLDVATVLRPIGTPPEAFVSSLGMHVIEPDDFRALLAPRRPDANKGAYGHVLVVGGSLGKAGAAAMAGMASLRIGAGLVTVATPRSQLPLVAGFAPELMTEPLVENANGAINILALEKLRELTDGKNVIACGMGASRDAEAGQFIRTMVDRTNQPLVLDADGLNAFSQHLPYLHGMLRPLILTPHPGEMARLAGVTRDQVQADRAAVARKFAQEHKCIVVLKGHRTLVATPDGQVWVNTTGNPGMATGGTGDILTGMIAGLLAQSPQAVLACVLAGVYLHGLSGDIAREEMGEMSLTATDLLLALPHAIRQAAQA